MKEGNNRNTPTPYSTVAAPAHGKRRPGATARDGGGRATRARAGIDAHAVSYTHLTLPTIYSV